MLGSAFLGLSCAAALILAPLGAMAASYTLTVTPSGGSLTGVSAVASNQSVVTGQAVANGAYQISLPSAGPFTLVGTGTNASGTTVGAVYFGATVSQSTYASAVTLALPAVPPTEVTAPSSIALTAGTSAQVAVSVYNATYGAVSDGAPVVLTPSAGLDLTPTGSGEAAVAGSVYAGTVSGVVYADLSAASPGTYSLTVSAPPGATLTDGTIPVTVSAAPVPCTDCSSGAPPPPSSTSTPSGGVGSAYSYDGVSGTVVLSATFDPTTAQDLTSQDGAVTLQVPADALGQSGSATLQVVEFSGAAATQLLAAGTTAAYEQPFGPLFLILATADGTAVHALAKPITARFDLAGAPAGTDDQLVDLMQVVPGGAPAFVGGAWTGAALQASLATLASGPYALMEVDRSFPDVPSGFWAQDDITLMASKFVVLGYPNGDFGPQNDVSRAEFTAMLLRMMGIPVDPSATPTFTDVPPGAWYYGVVATAEEHGIVEGVSSTSFEPNAPITREQIVTIFVRAAELQGWLQSSQAASGVQTMDARFTDAGQVDAYAQADMGVAVAAGLVKGITPTTLAPLALSTRAQAAAWTARLWRMFVA